MKHQQNTELSSALAEFIRGDGRSQAKRIIEILLDDARGPLVLVEHQAHVAQMVLDVVLEAVEGACAIESGDAFLCLQVTEHAVLVDEPVDILVAFVPEVLVNLFPMAS